MRSLNWELILISINKKLFSPSRRSCSKQETACIDQAASEVPVASLTNFRSCSSVISSPKLMAGRVETTSLATTYFQIYSSLKIDKFVHILKKENLTLQARRNISILAALFIIKATSPRATGRTFWCERFAAFSISRSVLSDLLQIRRTKTHK